MNKSSIPILDLLSKNSKKIAFEWFRIIEWLLIVGALSALQKYSQSTLLFSLTILSVIIIWVYVFFSCSEWFFESDTVSKTTSRFSFVANAIISTICCASFLTLANLIAAIALSFVIIQK
jgi:hypothetical protein